jgi:hypothetical protein
MSQPPDFHELVGDEGTPEELAALRRAHDLLVAAGPPPELSPRLAEPPRTRERVSWWHQRRNQFAFGLAAAVAAAAFGAGYLVGGNGSAEFSGARSLDMHGVGELAAARASLAVGAQDASGNYPLKMTVRGLPKPPKGGWYELLLSKQGRPTLSCGTFEAAGRAVTVRMNVPYDLSNFPKLFDGWVVTLHAPQQRHVPVVMTT